jgi:hypothetical protein
MAKPLIITWGIPTGYDIRTSWEELAKKIREQTSMSIPVAYRFDFGRFFVEASTYSEAEELLANNLKILGVDKIPQLLSVEPIYVKAN